MRKSEADRTLDFLHTAGPYANTAVKTAVLNEIMLQTGGQLLSRGGFYDIIARRLSPGVHKLSLRRCTA